MAKQHSAGEKLDEKLTEIGFPDERRGDARARGELFGVKTASVRQWITGRNQVPEMAWTIIKLYELLPDDARKKYDQWARERSEAED